MSLVAAAVCPHPPLIEPRLAGGAGAELDLVRSACDQAVRDLLGAGADLLAVIGAGPTTGSWPAPYGGTFAPFGVDRRVGVADPAVELPLSLLAAGWLLEHAGAGLAAARLWSVRGDETPAACAELGRAIRHAAPRVALLTMGDASACVGVKAPGYGDPRAEPFNASVAAALAAGDPAGLAGLDPVLARDLLVAGRAPWQVLAAAAGGRRWCGRLGYAGHPYGVGYLVASWS